MSQTVFETWHLDLQELLGLAVPPVAIAFVRPRSYRDRSHQTNHAAGQRRMGGPAQLRRVAYSGSRARKAFS